MRPASGGPHPGCCCTWTPTGSARRSRRTPRGWPRGGYCVLVPNVFYRDGRSPVLENLEQLMQSEDRGAAVRAARPQDPGGHAGGGERRLARPGWGSCATARRCADGPIGTVGYCMGGRFSLRMAGEFPDAVAAAASFHGAGMATDQRRQPAPGRRARAPASSTSATPTTTGSMDPEQMGRLTRGAGRGARAAHRGAVRGRAARLDADRRAGLRRGRPPSGTGRACSSCSAACSA